MNLKTVSRLGLVVPLVTLFAGAGAAMPLEQNYYSAPGVTADGRLDIQEILDNATEMEMRLSQQLLVLQDQIDRLVDEVDAIKATLAERQ